MRDCASTPPPRTRRPRRRRGAVVLAVWAAWLALVAELARADEVTVYLSADEAMKLAFPSATRFDVVDAPVPAEVRAALGEKLGEPFTAEHVEIRRAFAPDGGASETLAGRAVLNDDVGKYRPITYLVAVDPAGTVVRVELLVYRESHGGQVRGRSFLEQYEGKGTGDPIRVGKDITSISGATLSARAVSKGVKRTALLLEALDQAGVSGAPAGTAQSAPAPGASP